MSAYIDPRDVIPAASAPSATAELGDFVATEHDSTAPDRPNWRRYRIVHTPTGTVTVDHSRERTPVAELLAGVVRHEADRDPRTSDLYPAGGRGADNVLRIAVARYESARRALGSA